MIDAIEIQAQQIKNDRVTMRFEPRFVEYEPKATRCLSTDIPTSRASSNEERSERSYEFAIKISNYAPVLDY
nr:pilus assembly protein [Escherichia coli]